VIATVAADSVWTAPPPDPAMEPGEAAVWFLDVGATGPVQTVLAEYLGVQPGSVVLRRSSTGKPEPVGSPLQVSLAHSGEVALVAIAHGIQIGVDVERLRSGTDGWSLVTHALAAGEKAMLRAFPAARRSEAFLSMWTRKEAILKAAGVGLAVDPRLLELAGPRIVVVPPELGRARDWSLVDVELPGYAAALAVRGSLASVALYDARSQPGAERSA